MEEQIKSYQLPHYSHIELMISKCINLFVINTELSIMTVFTKNCLSLCSNFITNIIGCTLNRYKFGTVSFLINVISYNMYFISNCYHYLYEYSVSNQS